MVEAPIEDDLCTRIRRSEQALMVATVTDAGQALLDRAYQEVIILERALTDAFTPSEHASLCELLERATTVLIQQTRHATAPPAT
jgi:hypothetical protein